MKKRTGKAAGVLSVLFLVTAVLCVVMRLPQGIGENAAVAAAGFILPAGAAGDFFSEEEEDSSSLQSAGSTPESVTKSPVSSISPFTSGSVPLSSSEVNSPASSSAALSANILEMCINSGGTAYENIYVKNSNKSHSIDIGQELGKTPAVKIKKGSDPQVLIYHTHTTEAFSCDTRTTDKSRSVCAVGDEIAKQLKEAGIGVIHDTTYHDYPAYNGSYDRSKATVTSYLKKYSGIQVALDIHRDSMHRSDGTKLKPTAVINGQKAAQIMIISGCDDTGTLGFPNWEYNLRLALRLQKAIGDQYPDLARPLSFCPRRYNEDLTKGSLLIEVGTEVNTLDEATYSGQLVGKALADVLNKLT